MRKGQGTFFRLRSLTSGDSLSLRKSANEEDGYGVRKMRTRPARLRGRTVENHVRCVASYEKLRKMPDGRRIASKEMSFLADSICLFAKLTTAATYLDEEERVWRCQ